MQAALETADDNEIQVDFSKKKTKKKKKKKAEVAAVAKAEEVKGFNWNEGHTEYEYSFMLDRIETIMNEKSAKIDEEGKETRGELP